jgi:hypothetical protein
MPNAGLRPHLAFLEEFMFAHSIFRNTRILFVKVAMLHTNICSFKGKSEAYGVTISKGGFPGSCKAMVVPLVYSGLLESFASIARPIRLRFSNTKSISAPAFVRYNLIPYYAHKIFKLQE